MKFILMTVLAAFTLSASAQVSREVNVSEDQAGSFVNVKSAKIVITGRKSMVSVTATYSNGCMAANGSNVVFAAKYGSNSDKLSVSLISVQKGPQRMCSMEYSPVDVVFNIPVNTLGPADQVLSVSVNGVNAQ